jgi:hypothetical protein
MNSPMFPPPVETPVSTEQCSSKDEASGKCRKSPGHDDGFIGKCSAKDRANGKCLESNGSKAKQSQEPKENPKPKESPKPKPVIGCNLNPFYKGPYIEPTRIGRPFYTEGKDHDKCKNRRLAYEAWLGSEMMNTA